MNSERTGKNWRNWRRGQTSLLGSPCPRGWRRGCLPCSVLQGSVCHVSPTVPAHVFPLSLPARVPPLEAGPRAGASVP